MPREYSLYEAKAKPSALVRQVREGQSVVITVHGKPAAELRPIAKRPKKQANDARYAELVASGQITPAKVSTKEYAKILKRLNPKPIPGALERFLADRD